MTEPGKNWTNLCFCRYENGEITGRGQIIDEDKDRLIVQEFGESTTETIPRKSFDAVLHPKRAFIECVPARAGYDPSKEDIRMVIHSIPMSDN